MARECSSGRRTSGPSLDDRGHELRAKATPQGQEPNLGMAPPAAFARVEQTGGSMGRQTSDNAKDSGIVEEAKDALRGQQQ